MRTIILLCTFSFLTLGIANPSVASADAVSRAQDSLDEAKANERDLLKQQNICRADLQKIITDEKNCGDKLNLFQDRRPEREKWNEEDTNQFDAIHSECDTFHQSSARKTEECEDLNQQMYDAKSNLKEAKRRLDRAEEASDASEARPRNRCSDPDGDVVICDGQIYIKDKGVTVQSLNGARNLKRPHENVDQHRDEAQNFNAISL